MVLVEKFTNAFCGTCPDGTVVLEGIIDDYNDVIWISHHKPVGWTDNPLTNEASISLWNDIDVSGWPTAMVDRLPTSSNSLLHTKSNWRDRIDEQLLEPSYVEFEISELVFDPWTRDLHFNVNTVFNEIPTNGSPYHLHVFMVEDSVTGTEQHNYFNNVAGHPYEGRGDIMWDYHHRNVVRTILDDHWGVSEIIPNDPDIGGSYTKNFYYDMPQEYNPEKMSIVCALSRHDITDLKSRPVFNAHKFDLIDFPVTLLSDTKNEQSYELTISPNPSSGIYHINSKQEIHSASIYDISGRLIFTRQDLPKVSQIDLSGQANGQYILRLNTGTNQISLRLQKM